MAKGRLISTNFWTDGKVEDDFTPEDKYGYLWCLTNPHTNLCGCYEVTIKQMAHETGYNTDSAERLLRRLDTVHNVIRYNAATKELLVLNWFRYNWNTSEKLNKPLLNEIRSVKCDRFREYLADLYNDRETVVVPYESSVDDAWADEKLEDPQPEPAKEEKPALPEKNNIRHKYGEYKWVRLTDAEYEHLLADLGEAELNRCIEYVDESAQKNGNKNKWKDWNLVIRSCHRQQWGIGRQQNAAKAHMPEVTEDEKLERMKRIYSYMKGQKNEEAEKAQQEATQQATGNQ